MNLFNIGNYGYKNLINRNVVDLNPYNASKLISKTPIDTNQLNIGEPAKRSMLDRTFDLLSLPLYATAGAVKGFVDPETSVLGGFVGGIRAGNPFGKGYEEGETTYSDVLDSLGWKPTTTAGKIARGTVGFIGDVFLDPATYLSGGLTALTKGSGKALMKSDDAVKLAKEVATQFGVDIVGKNIDEIPYLVYKNTLISKSGKGVSDDVVKRLANKNASEVKDILSSKINLGMDIDKATEIVRSNSLSKSVYLKPDELARDAERLMSEYNRVVGVSKTGTDLTFGLKNAPFGEKLFPNAGEVSTVASRQALSDIGDKTIAPIFNTLRTQIYGSQLGKLFSTKSSLYQLAKSDPNKLYDYLKMVDITQGMYGNLQQTKKAIFEGAKALDLSPDDAKEVISILEDKAKWVQVKKAVKFGVTDEAKVLKKKVLYKKETLQGQLDEIINKKKTADTLLHGIKSELDDANNVLETMRKEYVDEIFNIKEEDILKSGKVMDVLNVLKDEVEQIKSQARLVKNDKTLKDTIESYDKYKAYLKGLDEIDNKGIYALSNSLSDVKINSKAKSQLIENGYIQYKTPKSSLAFEVEHQNWNKTSHIIDGKEVTRFTPPVKLTKQQTRTKFVEKVKLKDEISTYLYGKSDYLSNFIWDNHLDDLVEMIKTKPKGEVLKYVENNKQFFDGRANEMYSYIASELKFGSGYEYKNWKEFYTDRYDAIRNRYEKFGRIGREDEATLLVLEKASYKRAQMLKEFRDADTVSDVMAIKTRLSNDSMTRIAREVDDVEYPVNKRISDTRDIYDDKQARLGGYDRQDYRYGQQQAKTLSEKPYKLKSDEIESIRLDILDDYVVNNPRSKGIVSDKHIQWSNAVSSELQGVMDSFFANKIGDRVYYQLYDDLTYKQKELLKTMAIQNATRKANGTFKILDDDILKHAEAKATIKRNSIINEIKTSAITREVGKDSKLKLKNGDTVIVKDVTFGKTGIPNIKAVDAITGEIKEVLLGDIKGKLIGESGVLNLDDIINTSETTKSFLNSQYYLEDHIKKIENAIVGNKEKLRNQIDSLKQDFIKRADNVKVRVEELNTKHDELLSGIYDVDKQTELIDRIKEIEDALSSDDAFETIMRSKLGDAKIDNIIDKNSAFELFIDSDKTIDDRIRETTKFLKQEFIRFGSKEVEIGKLKLDQFTSMFDNYFPHMLTAEGTKLFDTQKDLQNSIKNFGNDFGYGRKFNPYSKTRNMKFAKDANGNFIKNPNLTQINEFLMREYPEILQGKNAFSENLADVYIARATKNAEVLYDNAYSKTMLNMFGKRLGKNGAVDEGYKVVTNYGALKESVNKSGIELSKFKIRNGDIRKFDDIYQESIKEVIEKLELNANTFDDLATPLIQLTPEQAIKVSNLDSNLVKQVNDVIVEHANKSRTIQIQKDNNNMLNLYDKFTHFMKLQQTTIIPSFHMRNKISNTFNNWIAIGSDALDIDMQKKTYEVMKRVGDVDGVLAITKPNGVVDSIEWKTIFDKAKEFGVIDEGFFAQDLRSGVASEGLFKNILPTGLDPTDTKNFKPYKIGANFGTLIEGQDRLIHFASELSRGKSFKEATESVNKFLFDYSDLTIFEQTVMKRIFPYYTWLRKNAPLQLEMMLDKPEQYRNVSKILGGIEGMSDREDRMQTEFTAEFAGDMIQTPFTVGGKNKKGEDITKNVLWNPNLPFGDINRIPDPTDITGTLRELISQVNPLIKVPIEQITNNNTYFNSPITKEKGGKGRLDNVASQFSAYNVSKGFVDKKDSDFMFHLLNNTSGVKFTSYDYDNYKRLRIAKQAVDRKRKEINKDE